MVVLAWLVTLVVVGTGVIGLGACVSEGDHYAASARVTEGWDAIAESPGGVVVRIPDGAASGGELSVARVDDVAGLDAEFAGRERHPDPVESHEVGPAVEVTLEGGELTGELTVEIPLSDVSDQRLVGAEQWDPGAQSWVPVTDDRVEVADGLLTLDSDVLGVFRPVWMSLGVLVDELGSTWERFMSPEPMGAEPPRCPDGRTGDLSAQARDADGQGLLTCSAITADGVLVVEVVNDKPFPVEIHVPDDLEPNQRSTHGRSLMTVLSALGSTRDPVIGPAEGIRLQSRDPVAGKLTIETYVTPRSWSVAMLDMVVSTYADLWEHLIWATGAPDGRTSTDELATAVPDTPCVLRAVARTASDIPIDMDPAGLFRDAARCGAQVLSRAVEGGSFDPEAIDEVKRIVTEDVTDRFAALDVAAEFPEASQPG